MKTITLEPGYEDYTQREFDILCTIDHPFVMNPVEVYFSPIDQALNLVVPFYEGGEVQAQIEERERLDEQDCAMIIYQLLLALNYMHARQISHGDLKPENLVFERSFAPGKLPFTRLIDFGFAVDRNDTLYKRHGIRSTEFGTPIYMAPEKLYNKPLEEKSDNWSVGVMAYYMLAGYPPFWSDNEKKLFHKIKTCDFEFYNQEWSTVSQQAKDFVSNLLEPNLDMRMSAAEALRHKWIQQHVRPPPLNKAIISSFFKHRKLNDFQHLCMLVLCEVLSLADHGFITEAQQQFFVVNKSLTGEICYLEFREACLEAFSCDREQESNEERTATKSEEEIKEAYDTVDRDLSDDVTWSEW